jgi:hypothetical protein
MESYLTGYFASIYYLQNEENNSVGELHENKLSKAITTMAG